MARYKVRPQDFAGFYLSNRLVSDGNNFVIDVLAVWDATGQVSVQYEVRDLKRPVGDRIVYITGSLIDALDRYNSELDECVKNDAR